MPDPLKPKSASGLDRRQVLSAAASLAATLGISSSAISPALAAAKPRRSQLTGPFDSFRDYIRALEEHGLLLRVQRLDEDQYELAALTYRLIDEFGWYGAPAVLVEEIKQDGHWMKGPVITNHQGHWDTEAIIWGKEPVAGNGPETYRQILGSLYELIDKAKGKLPQIPTNPVSRERAPVKEIVLRGEQVNLLDFAFIKSNPADSARYVNTGSVFTADPELGMNFGTYRCEIQGPRMLGVNPEDGQGAYHHFMQAKLRGEKSVKVSIALGQDPVTWVVSSSKMTRA